MKIIPVTLILLISALISCEAVEIQPRIGYGFLLNDVGSLGANESQTKGGFNGSLGVMAEINSNISVGGEIGYMPIYKWKYNTAPGWSMDLTYDAIPVLGVLKYSFSGNSTFKPYCALNCGIFITGLKTISIMPGVETDISSSKNYFGGAIGLGTIIKFKSFDLDVSARYMFINDDTSEKTKILNVNLGTRFKVFEK